MPQEIPYLIDVLECALENLDALNHLQNHPASVDDTMTTTSRTPNSQHHLRRSILSGLGEIVIFFIRCGSSGVYS